MNDQMTRLSKKFNLTRCTLAHSRALSRTLARCNRYREEKTGKRFTIFVGFEL